MKRYDLTNGTPFMQVLRLANEHKDTWQDKSEAFWLFGLLEEVFELIGALIGWHKDEPETELLQIAAICMNWIKRRQYK